MDTSEPNQAEALVLSADQTSAAPQTKPPRICVICYDSDLNLIKPCRRCQTDYCEDCLLDTFKKAAEGTEGRVPVRCCEIIQISTVLAALPKQQADKYRARFEEWLTTDKVYCPSPTCSAFISEKYLLSQIAGTQPLRDIGSVCMELLSNVEYTPPARFFRGNVDIDELPTYAEIITTPVSLRDIRRKIEASGYSSTGELTHDMGQILVNAQTYNGPSHPVVKAAQQLFSLYSQSLSQVTDRLVQSKSNTCPLDIFPCPKCHLSLCMKCKRVEHRGKECDTSEADDEKAMLVTFGYKQCPLCKTGVKKMYGCSHMQCRCGAHWCWWCARPTDQCDGGCEASPDADNEDDEDLSSDESDKPGDPEERNTISNIDSQTLPSVEDSTPVMQQGTIQHPPTTAESSGVLVNLDAGGAAHWEAQADLDFGEEPEDEHYHQAWACKHRWTTYKIANDGFDHGNNDLMECNFCFQPVVPSSKTTSIPSKRGRPGPVIIPESNSQQELPSANAGAEKKQDAWECADCYLVSCTSCKANHEG